MTRQNQIKVFKPNSKQADFTVRSVTPQAGARRLEEVLGDKVARKASQAFDSLQKLGADSLVFHAANRKIKVELAHA